MKELSLDEALQEILGPFDVRTARTGPELVCQACGAKTTYTYGDKCGACYLVGRPLRLN